MFVDVLNSALSFFVEAHQKTFLRAQVDKQKKQQQKQTHVQDKRLVSFLVSQRNSHLNLEFCYSNILLPEIRMNSGWCLRLRQPCCSNFRAKYSPALDYTLAKQTIARFGYSWLV